MNVPISKRSNTTQRERIVTTASSVPMTHTLLEKQATCDHNWERDGQTMTSVRWTCTKCLKTELC